MAGWFFVCLLLLPFSKDEIPALAKTLACFQRGKNSSALKSLQDLNLKLMINSSRQSHQVFFALSRIWAEWIKSVYIRSFQSCAKCIFIIAIIIMPSFSGSSLFSCKKFHTCIRVMQWDRYHKHGCIYKCHPVIWESQLIVESHHGNSA